MRRETEAFLSRVRNAEDPTSGDEERVRQALRAALAADIGSSIDPSVWHDVGSPTPVLGPLAGWGSKLGWIGVCAAAVFGTGDTPRSPEPASDPKAAAAPHVVELKAAPEQAATSAANPSVLQMKSGSAPVARKSPPKQPGSPPSALGRPRQELGGEIALLRRVQAALQRRDGETALRELDAHVTSDRTLLPERRAARILALCQLGRIGAARLAQAEFMREHPDSIQRQAVERACANR